MSSIKPLEQRNGAGEQRNATGQVNNSKYWGAAHPVNAQKTCTLTFQIVPYAFLPFGHSSAVSFLLNQ